MTEKVYALDTKPGIQRDGTDFDKNFYNGGSWVRFQRGRPRKIGGYREITGTFAGPSRGIYVNPQNAFTNVFNGHSDGLQVLPIDNDGVGAALTNFTLNNFTKSPLNLWQFDTFTDVTGSGENLLLAHPGQNLGGVDSSTNTPVLAGPITGTTLSKVGTFTDSITTTSGLNTVTLPASNLYVGAGQLVTASGIPSGTTVVSVVGTTVTLSAPATASATVTATFDNQISVSGGVVSLHPYVFVYGNNGMIKNCSSGNIQDWVSADANETNVATGKIVQGLPVRGGSNAPSGLFWSLDSLIRVSYAPTTINVGTSQITQYWRYDVVTAQSSILSSQSVIEYDGIFYWCGVDRFLAYNGVVKEMTNDMNQNYFFDNLNYQQRQKVWATKVPRYGEIWWFYPRGSATECTDAIIFNVREQTWYDAGEAVGARRSAGYFSQVFHYPISADWQPNVEGAISALVIGSPGSGYTDGTYPYTPLTGGTGTGATATITVSAGLVTNILITNQGKDYGVGETLFADISGGEGFAAVVSTAEAQISLYQHEFGTDQIKNGTPLAIDSYFETNDIGWVGGGPAQPSMEGLNRWIHLERLEPDFLQQGTMELYVTGRPYAQKEDLTTGPYTFEPNTGKIDLREQRREMRLIFKSNTLGGDYQLGKVIVSTNVGDQRGY